MLHTAPGAQQGVQSEGLERPGTSWLLRCPFRVATAFTHAFVGASIASLPDTSVPKVKLCLVGAALAVAPDLDIAAFGLGLPYDHPLGHRGFTHSVLFAALAGAVGAGLLSSWRQAPNAARVAVVLAAAVASHGLLDAFTDAGLGVAFLFPWSEGRFFFPWRPLATSPLSIRAFFDGPAAPILLNEFLLVWLPTLLGLWIWRKRQRSLPRRTRG